MKCRNNFRMGELQKTKLTHQAKLNELSLNRTKIEELHNKHSRILASLPNLNDISMDSKEKLNISQDNAFMQINDSKRSQISKMTSIVMPLIDKSYANYDDTKINTDQGCSCLLL